jgi:hypothetical protein
MIMQIVFQMDMRESDFTATVEMVALEVNTQ